MRNGPIYPIYGDHGLGSHGGHHDHQDQFNYQPSPCFDGSCGSDRQHQACWMNNMQILQALGIAGPAQLLFVWAHEPGTHPGADRVLEQLESMGYIPSEQLHLGLLPDNLMEGYTSPLGNFVVMNEYGELEVDWNSPAHGTRGGGHRTRGGGSRTRGGGSRTRGGGSRTRGGGSRTRGGGSRTRGGGRGGHHEDLDDGFGEEESDGLSDVEEMEHHGGGHRRGGGASRGRSRGDQVDGPLDEGDGSLSTRLRWGGGVSLCGLDLLMLTLGMYADQGTKVD